MDGWARPVVPPWRRRRPEYSTASYYTQPESFGRRVTRTSPRDKPAISPSSLRGALGVGGAIWAIAGIAGLLGWAIVRLAEIALGALEVPLAWYHWAAIGAIIPFMAWSEGWRGFQRRFSPRVAERAMLIRAAPTAARVIFAPLFAAGFFGGSRREQMGACLGTVAIILLVIVVHHLDQPWRGILDAGVVAGLTWGVVATLALSAKAWRTAE